MMASLGSIAGSGMAAAEMRLGASAHNIANALTAGFKRQTVDMASQAGGGVTTTFGTAPDIGNDLAGDLVASRESLYAFKANAQVIRTADKMLGSLLDTLA